MIVKNILKQIKKSDDHVKKIELTYELMEHVNSMIALVSSNEIEDIMEELEDAGIEVRQCTCCNHLMEVGYVVNGGDEYYCSDECLHEEVGEEEWKKLTAYLIDADERTEEEEEWANEYGDTDSYWTEWN